MAWTDEVMTAVRDSLSTQEKAASDAILQYYKDDYTAIDKVFSKIYHLHLPGIYNYSPIRRVKDAVLTGVQLLTGDVKRFASPTNASLKSRVGSIAPLVNDDIFNTWINHATAMEHFKAWAEPISDLRAVIRNKEFRTATRQYHGNDILSRLDSAMNDIARGSVDRARTIKQLDQFRASITKSILAKPAISAKQTISFAAYLTEMPTADFFDGIADFWKNPVGNARFLQEHSPSLKARFHEGFERDVRLAMRTGTVKTLLGKGNFTNKFMAGIRLFDKFAVEMGSWAKYKSEMKGKAETKENITAALDEAMLSTSRTQPTFDIETLSEWQRGGSLMKLFTMFQTQTNKYYRIGTTSLRNLEARRGSPAKNISNLILVWSLLPAIFQFISDAFQFKPKHMFKAAALGPLNTILIFGQLLQSAYGWVTQEGFDYQATPLLAPINYTQRIVGKGWKIARAGLDPTKDIETGDVVAMIEYMALIGGMVTGMPTPYAVQVERAIISEEPKELLFSKYALSKEETAAEKAKAATEAKNTAILNILSQNRFNEEYADLTNEQQDIIKAEMP